MVPKDVLVLVSGLVNMLPYVEEKTSHQSQGGDVMTEAEFGVMYFEERRRGHEPKNADNPGKGKEIDHLLDSPERVQLSQHLNF